MTTIMHDIQHHAKDKAEVVNALGVLFATELNPLGWQALKAGKGNNSWRIYKPGDPTKIWYFTGYEKNAVIVRNNYWWNKSTRRFTIRTRTDAIKFAAHVAKSG